MKRFSHLTIVPLLALVVTTFVQAQSANTRGGADQSGSIAATATQDQQTGTQPPRQTRPQQQRPSTSQVPAVPPLSEEDTRRLEAARQRRQQAAASGDVDVLLDIPQVTVQEITLEVDNLKAHVSLDARLANLLQLSAGVDASIDKVKLTIKGVRAEALLKVRLDNVADIIDRTLTTIDRNPQLLERLLQTVDNTVGTVGSIANTALQPGGLLSQTVNTLGHTVQRTLDATGNILERTLDTTTGRLVNERTLGNLMSLTDLTVLSETTNASGQIVRRVRDTSGAVIEMILDRAGKLLGSRVISQATSR